MDFSPPATELREVEERLLRLSDGDQTYTWETPHLALTHDKRRHSSKTNKTSRRGSAGPLSGRSAHPRPPTPTSRPQTAPPHAYRLASVTLNTFANLSPVAPPLSRSCIAPAKGVPGRVSSAYAFRGRMPLQPCKVGGSESTSSVDRSESTSSIVKLAPANTTEAPSATPWAPRTGIVPHAINARWRYEHRRAQLRRKDVQYVERRLAPNSTAINLLSLRMHTPRVVRLTGRVSESRGTRK